MLGALVKELAVLPRSDRAAILAALDASERERVLAALRNDLPAPVEPHSVWLTGLIATEEGGMTAAGRAALLTAVGRAAGERPAGRSLLQAAGCAFAAGRAR